MGITLPALAGVFLLYAVYGNLLPVNISHRGYPWGRVLTDLYSQEAMFGLVLNVTATYVVLFVVFGALINRFGAGDRSEEPTSELQSLMRITYAALCLKTKPT